MADRRFFLLMAFIGGVAILGSTMSKTPVLPLFAAQLGATPAEIGWVVIASTVPGILVSFLVGVMADTLGKRPMIIGSLVVFATAPFLYLGVSSAVELMTVRFYHGFATAIFGTVAAAAIAERYPQQRAAMLSTFSSATLVGRSIAPFLGGFLISMASFHSVYIACGISGVLALLAGLALPRGRKSASPSAVRAALERPPFFESLRQVLSNRGIVLTSVLEAAQLLVFGAVEAFLALYAASVGIMPWQIGVILGAQLLGIVVIKPFMGALSDRWGRRTIILPGLLVGALSVGMMPLAQEMLTLCFLSIVFGVGYAMVTSSTSALVADLTRGGKFGASMGVLRTVMDIGQTIGPVVTGLMVVWFGYGVAFAALAVVLLSATLIFAVAPQLGRQAV